ncbi:AKAP7 2'5' RNA ligase-like domain protein [Gregarina niphandrodes]|uniref:AKAP7 2'5' RNA ligase-like domain protein n=1 Tax=Gregarina niphandrodes TaxID=110365 RepID=A0A023B7U6_GRENI|nr:AKAP7 2'5' RNA ligase-like domain protein [Gregarina niphandrodes]EZG67896.1 AKAP7 2'5' RNA ligase-like domain protein [Gregarina niphandrodes]|eukprot:XP_011130144.1 AKAP7 2'5' RNA ligase-like domain protein [Gregarina niphandrodes]
MNEGKYDNDERIRARGCDTARRYVAADNCTGDESPELDAGRFRDTRRFEDPDRFADRFTDPVEREGGGVRVSEWADLDVRHEGGVRSTVPFASLTMAERPAVMESVASSMECAARLEDEPKMDRPVSGGSRASHFIAFRIDDPDAVDRFVAFQDAICEQHPFLDIGRTNPQKFHLTLLVLSLRPSEIEVAVQAMNAGIEMFRKRMAQTLNLEFRTVGAFNTRLLFVAPSLRQRLILDALHVDLARACGAHGLTIVGAGAGWTSAMALKHKIQATGVGLSHVKLARPRDGTGAAEEAAQNTMTVNEPCSSVSNDYTPSPEDIKRSSAAATFRETLESSLHSTPLDRSLLKKYDITGYRNTFYVPQVSVFKMGKANRKNKNAKYTPPQLSHTLPI